MSRPGYFAGSSRRFYTYKDVTVSDALKILTSVVSYSHHGRSRNGNSRWALHTPIGTFMTSSRSELTFMIPMYFNQPDSRLGHEVVLVRDGFGNVVDLEFTHEHL